jgi:hypothetical protein
LTHKRKGTTASYATGDMERYLKAMQAEGSHFLDEGRKSEKEAKKGTFYFLVLGCSVATSARTERD